MKLTPEQVADKIKFIHDYVNGGNAASASKVDANANVTVKNLATLQAELHKDINIQINRALVKDQLTSLFGKDVASKYEKDLHEHIIYCHDETSLSPYTYSARETLAVIYKGERLLLSYEDLYALSSEPEVVLDEKNGVWGKYPADLFIYDAGDTKTRITRLVKKVRHRDLVRVKTAFGEDLYVTDNHPLIVSDDDQDTVEAAESLNSRQFRALPSLEFGGKSTVDTAILPGGFVSNSEFTMSNGSHERIDACNRHVMLSEDFGYFVGMFVAEGHYVKINGEIQGICVTQNDPKLLNELAEILYKDTGVASKVYKENLPPSHAGRNPKYNLLANNRVLATLFKDYFGIHDYAQNKNLPYNTLEFSREFVRGMIAGVCDGDGTASSQCLLLRVASRQLISQLTTLLPQFGYGVSNTISLPNATAKSYIKTQYPMFGVSFGKRENSETFRSFKMLKVEPRTRSIKYSSNTWATITNVEKITNAYFLAQNEFIYDITTESSTFLMNNIWVHNCTSVSMYPFLLEGMLPLGGESGAPKHLESFIGSFGNLVFAISAQFAGAVATVEFLMYFDHFARKDYGEAYLDDPELRKLMEQKFQHVVYVLNQPATARGYQSVFWNVSIFDKYFFDSMFGSFVFPDGDTPSWESLNKLQKFFVEWFREERKRALLTFPVITLSALTDGETWKDQEYLEWASQEYAQGSEFFIYTSETVDSLSSCCFTGDQKTLTRSSNGINYLSFKDLHEGKWLDIKRNWTIFHNGSWVKGDIVKIPRAGKKIFAVTTSNNKVLNVTEDHLHPTLRGDIPTSELTTSDYLLCSTRELPGYADAPLSYEEGLVVGAYLGDGSLDYKRLPSGERKAYATIFSMNDGKVAILGKAIRAWASKLNLTVTESQKEKLHSVDVIGAAGAAWIQQWITGESADTKALNLEVVNQSPEFRKGILDGWCATDGGNSNRCYTTSKALVEGMELLLTTLGIQSVVDVSDRTSEPVVIRGEVFKRNFPLYCLRWYTPSRKRTMEGVYQIENNSTYFKVAKIEQLDCDDEYVYCFDMRNSEEPYFTLPNGVITHNCRLRNTLQDNEFSYSLGAGGVMTGSKNVITINLNRVTQRKEDLSGLIDRVHMYQVAHDALYKWYFENDLLTVYKAGFIDLKKQFLTIGVNGIVEAAEFLGYTIGNNTQYKAWLEKTLAMFRDKNKEAGAKYGLKFNTEIVPAENLGVKNAAWDKKAGLQVPRDCYNSYFYKVEDPSLSVFDKMELHGGSILQHLDGGSALHFNNNEKLDAAQYKVIFRALAVTGSNYFCENTPRSICKKCGYIHPNHVTACPKCGGEVEYAVRVIGYLKKISDFSKERQKEAARRFYE